MNANSVTDFSNMEKSLVQRCLNHNKECFPLKSFAVYVMPVTEIE